MATRIFFALVLVLAGFSPLAIAGPPPRPPESISAFDHPWDDGTRIDVVFKLSPDDQPHAEPPKVARYVVERAAEPQGPFETVAGPPAVPDAEAYRTRTIKGTIEKCRLGEPYWFRVKAVAPDGTASAPVETTAPAVATRQIFDGERLWLLVILTGLCGMTIYYIVRARRGRPVKVRRIAGLRPLKKRSAAPRKWAAPACSCRDSWI